MEVPFGLLLLQSVELVGVEVGSLISWLLHAQDSVPPPTLKQPIALLYEQLLGLYILVILYRLLDCLQLHAPLRRLHHQPLGFLVQLLLVSNDKLGFQLLHILLVFLDQVAVQFTLVIEVQGVSLRSQGLDLRSVDH